MDMVCVVCGRPSTRWVVTLKGTYLMCASDRCDEADLPSSPPAAKPKFNLPPLKKRP